MLRIASLIFILALTWTKFLTAPAPPPAPVGQVSTWAQLKMGGQGFVPSIQIATDGSMVARSDAAGPWGRTVYTNNWTPLVSYPGTTGFPSAVMSSYQAGCDIAIANSNTSHLYMWFTNTNVSVTPQTSIYSSTDRGQHWTATNWPTREQCFPNAAARLWGRKVVVDPTDENTVYVNTWPSGVYWTTNGGTTWNILTSIPPSVLGAGANSTDLVQEGTGSKSFTLTSSSACGNTIIATQPIQIFETGNLSNQMVGTVTSCSGNALVANIVTNYGDTNNHNDWSMFTDSGTDGHGLAGNVVAFDPVNAHTVYIAVQQHAVYKCTSANTATPSCSALTTTSGPSGAIENKLYVDNQGTLWAVDNSDSGGDQGHLFRFLSGAWQQQSLANSGTTITAIAVNPTSTGGCASGACGYAANSAGCIWYTTGAQGATPSWTATGPGSCSSNTDHGNISSTVIPWLQTSNDNFKSIQWLEFDPTQSNVLYAAAGFGIMKTNPPTSGTANVSWNADETAGIENANVTFGQSIPGGGIYVLTQDRSAWSLPVSAYPTAYAPPGDLGAPHGMIFRGGCINSTAAMLADLNGLRVTLDPADINSNTSTWTGPFAPTGLIGNPYYGSCAALDSTHWFWLTGENDIPIFTANSGSTWSKCTFNNNLSGGTVTADGGGFQTNGVPYPNPVGQDATTPSTILIYNNGTGGTNGANAGGFWQSTSSSSCVFTQLVQNSILNGGSMGVQAVPGNHNHFFASLFDRPENVPGSGLLYHTTDGGTTWNSVSGVKGLLAWGFGAAKPGGDGYPVFYCACLASTDGGSTYHYGIFESDNIDNATPTWINIDSAENGFPGGNFDSPTFVQGDLATYGTVYVGFNNSGGMIRTVH